MPGRHSYSSPQCLYGILSDSATFMLRTRAEDATGRREAAARPINASTTAPVTRVRLLITLSFLSLDVTRFTKLIIIRFLCPCPPGQEAASSAVPPTARRRMNICTPFRNDPDHGSSACPFFLSFHR